MGYPRFTTTHKPRNGYKRLTPEQRVEALRRYAEGERSGLIAKDMGCTNTAINVLARKHGLDTNRTSRRVPLNQDAFAVITPETAYWVGFLMADGCVSGRQLVVNLADKDRDHLIALMAFMGSGHKLRLFTQPAKHSPDGNQMCAFTLDSPKIVADLARFGVVRNKTYGGHALQLENDRDFWRGVIDGDGCLGEYFTRSKVKKYAHVSVSNTRALMIQFVDYVERHVLLGRRLHITGRNDTACAVQVRGGGAIAIIRHFYESAVVALPRKRALALALIEKHGG